MGLLNTIKTVAQTVGRFVYHNRADIAFYGGLTGSVVGTVLITKGAVKSQPALNEYKEKRKQINEATDLTEEERKNLSKENTVTTVKVVGKNLLPGVIVEGVSKGAEIYGHHTLHSDLDKATSLANGLAASIALLHERIAADQGEDKWREYAYGQDIASITTVDENGNVTEENEVHYSDVRIDDFSRDFRLSNTFSEAKGANLHTLSIYHQVWNDRLAFDKDKVFLRDVWKGVFGSLDGFKEEWANAGWLYEDLDGTTTTIKFWPDKENMDAQTKAFFDGQTPDIRLVFNCYPDVYYIEKLKKQRAKNK